MKATQLLNISPQIGSMNGGKVELTSATITGKKYENQVEVCTDNTTHF